MANFNGQNGCLKCTTVGEYSYVSHCNVFPRINCPKRTNEGFREKIYDLHHKHYSPLEELPIDMVEDFPIGDSLHLLDLGIMKRCLFGWRDGHFGTYRTKWCARESENISKFLKSCKMPSEIHRSVRGLDCLSHWKGTEYRTFLYYIGIVVLRKSLPYDVYEHFLVLFCAVTICSSKEYETYLDLAETLLNHYIEYYRDIYGEDYITSNVHNLSHLVDEVRRYGVLSSFNSYPFENKLYMIKTMLRTGRNPLAQVAKRLYESESVSICQSNEFENDFPILKNKNDGDNFPHKNERMEFYNKIEFRNYCLSIAACDKWFLTYDKQVVGIKNIILKDEKISIYGSCIAEISEYFETPIKSSYLNIFLSNSSEKPPQEYSLKEIKCKLVCIQESFEKNVFIPLIHTL